MIASSALQRAAVLTQRMVLIVNVLRDTRGMKLAIRVKISTSVVLRVSILVIMFVQIMLVSTHVPVCQDTLFNQTCTRVYPLESVS